MRKFLLSSLILLFSLSQASATDYFFFGGGGDANYTTAVNWDSGIVPPATLIAGDNVFIAALCNFNAAGFVIAPSGTAFEIYDTFTDGGGSLDIRSGASVIVDVGISASVNNFYNASSSSIDGSLTVSGDTRISTGTTTLTNGAMLISNGTLRLSSGGTLTVNIGAVSDANGNIQFIGAGTINVNGTLRRAGSISNTGTLTFGTSSTYVLDGTNPQTMRPLTLNLLEINNSAGVSLNGNITVNGDVTMTSGVLSTTASFQVLLNGPPSAILTEKPSSYINGNTVVTPYSANSGTKNFGNIGISLTITSGTGPSNITVTRQIGTVVTGAGNTGVSRSYSFSHGGTPTYTADLVFSYFEQELNGINESDLQLYVTQDGADYDGLSTSRNAAANTLTTNGISNVNSSTFAAGDQSNPLPVELVAFAANWTEQAVVLKWVTASEQDNRGFEVQRSTDGETWEMVGWVDGAGNSSSMLHYSYDDREGIYAKKQNADLLYRLKQIDMNGEFEYSHVIKVGQDDGEKSVLKFYPNPASDQVKVYLSGQFRENLYINIYNSQGILVQSTSGLSAFSVAQLQDGIYHVRAVADGQALDSRQLIVRH